MSQTTLPEMSVAHSAESFRNTFYLLYACFSHFTVGSSKTRQITIRGLGLNTTNHDMRPIGLTKCTIAPVQRNIFKAAQISQKGGGYSHKISGTSFVCNELGLRRITLLQHGGNYKIHLDST